ncbi:MAG: dinitrogenase iron-molybdenum cofactor biosynthesis protein [Desulfovibrionales bacterium]|nr:MAG: dinitrogenase iron-molybdenum cofactor biosynthesis protein [Desulfovibrionales bacterium]
MIHTAHHVRSVLLVAQDGCVAPRFDMALEAMLATEVEGMKQSLILPQSSAEELCHLIMKESVQEVVCGGIEDEFFQYLTWKKVRVLDNVIGPVDWALERWKAGKLQAGDIFRQESVASPEE